MPITRLPGAAIAPDHTFEFAPTEIVAFPVGDLDLYGTGGTFGTTANDGPLVRNKIHGTNGDDQGLYGTTGHDEIRGYAGNDTLFGLAGRDYLDGGTGVDVMAGGQDNDNYRVDTAADVVWEWGGEGIDTVWATVDYVLPVAVENLVMTESGGTGATQGTGNELANDIYGNGGGNRLYGLDGADRLFGQAGDDFLYGGNGRDELNGGSGADQMVGGIGQDIYFVDNAGDVVWEFGAFSALGDDCDEVRTSIDYQLPDTIEYLVSLAPAGTVLNATGNALTNGIQGGAGHEVLRGLGGFDHISAGAGDDVLIGGMDADTMTGGEGADAFVLNAIGEIGVHFWSADYILDFSRAQGDRIDLTGIDANVYANGDQAFTFIGQGAFTGAIGEINYVHVGNDTLIQMQTGMDADVEGAIRLYGIVTPEASWFNL